LLLPYSFAREGNAYTFVTDKGLSYKAYFVEYPFLTQQFYSLSFDKVFNIDTSEDPRVSLTIIYIIEDFFSRGGNMLGYTCDASDDRQKGRRRLFSIWFARYNKGQYVKYDFQQDNTFISIIAKQNEENIDAVKSEVDELLQILSSKP